MAAPVTIRNLRDTFVHEAKPKKNFINTARMKLVGSGASNTMYAYLFFGKPWPTGATIQSAKLRVWNADAWAGTITLSAQRILQAWAGNRINWDNKPSVAATTYSVTKTNAGARTMWEIDITSVIQYVANGGEWYGLRLSANGSATKKLFSTQAEAAQYRPQVIIQWSDAPDAPDGLSPSGNRVVSKNKPLLTYNFTDPAGDTTLAAQQVQLATSSTGFGSPVYDSTWRPTSVPEFDLANPPAGADPFTAMGVGNSLWWRVRVRDGAGLESQWSTPSQFTYRPHGTLTSAAVGTRVLRTNLAVDPDMEASGTGAYSVANGATISKVTAAAIRGGLGLLVSAPSNGITDSGVSLGSISLSAGQTVTVSADVRSIQAQTLCFSPQGTAAPTAPRVNHTFEVGETKRIHMTFTATNTGTANIYLLRTDGSVVTTWHVDALTINLGTSTEHFSGSTSDTGVIGPKVYAWTGAANNSTSTESQLYVEETSPPIVWALSGQTQVAYRVIVENVARPNKPLFDTGKVTSAVDSIDTPNRLITDINATYRITIYVWDQHARERNGNDQIPVMYQREFVYAPVSVLTPPTLVSAAPDYPWPWVQLDFSRPTPPDSFTVVRDGDVVESDIDPGDVHIGGTNYRYIDRTPAPRINHEYRVVAKVNRVDSAPSNAVNAKPKPTVTFMANPDMTSPIAIAKSASEPSPVVEAQLGYMQETHQPIGGGSPILITQFLSGYEGHVDGVLADDIIPVSAREMRNRFRTWKRNPGSEVLLYMVDEVLRVVPYNMTYRPRAKGGGQIVYDISFDFFEVDD